MENEKVINFMELIIRSEIIDKELLKSREALTLLSDIAGCVCIDSKKMLTSVDECFDSKKISNKFAEYFDAKDDSENALSEAEKWLTVRPMEFKAVVQKIADILSGNEKQAEKAVLEEKVRGDELFDKCERLTKEYNDLKYLTEANERLVAERIQYMLYINSDTASETHTQLVELLKDIDIDAYYDSAAAPLTDNQMFTELKVNDEAMTGIKPCLIRNSSVYIKGIRIVKG